MEPQTAKTTELVAAGQRRYVPNYAPKEMILDRGEGARVWDADGNEYVDLGAGISVTSLGHGDPELARALIDQAGRLWHTSNLYFVEPAVRLAEELCEASFADRVFFCNSGAEANEAAIKLARKHASLRHGPEKREIVTFRNGFHGRTLATVTATAQPKYHEGFEPLPGGFRYCSYNDAAALDDAIGDRTCAVLVEPVQGEGGDHPRREGLPRGDRRSLPGHDALLMLDEIQSGLARTGRLFAYQWEEGLVPDVVTPREGASFAAGCRSARCWSAPGRPRPSSRGATARPSGATRSPPRWRGWCCGGCAPRNCLPMSSVRVRGCANASTRCTTGSASSPRCAERV